ncbi:hypothetical protein MATL_G00257940 [Megalops atlanticus]|uniref:Uncharacterized protein n=1 Tax=Megalops atlanticus TaxID=7932 RepID=A0A9D3PCT6_MEGAT|nr:hypothetical protein MATL_G00257940 [Megalops atlanticus]
MHAKAHDLKCEIKWGGGNQVGAGSTSGEEVEQVNSFLSRLAITTKFMSKPARTNMLTLQCMAWNKTKEDNMCSMLCKRFHKTHANLAKGRESLKVLQSELLLDETQTSGFMMSRTGLRVDQGKTDTSKRRKTFRRRIREAKTKLPALLNEDDAMVEAADRVGSVDVFKDNHGFPWQLPCDGTVGILTKKRIFDKVMAVRRLEEEEVILLKEMRQHWKSLRQRELTLQNAIVEEGPDSGLRCILSRKLNTLQMQLKGVREAYLQIFQTPGTHAEPLIELDDDDGGKCESSSESSSDDENV